MISALCTHTYSLYVGAIPSFRSEYPRTELWHLAREDYVIRQFILVGDSDNTAKQRKKLLKGLKKNKETYRP